MKIVFQFVILLLILSCNNNSNTIITVQNTLNTNRSFETVTLDLEKLRLSGGNESIFIEDFETGEKLISQVIDENNDGKFDVLLFQPEMPANSERKFNIKTGAISKEKDSIPACYSRFVPERTDDYAWENNRVAFRTYGPRAQEMIESNINGGTLSSGIDAWLKRVEYPIINKWYKKETSNTGSYHEDTGEGLDNFHVGISRGVGGIAKKVDSTYYISKNFTAWKTLFNGPIRTSFILEYASWDAGGKKISEKKKISLDNGSNLSKFEVTVKGTDTISSGLTLHEREGEITTNDEYGWVSYWEPHDDSQLGTGIVVPNNTMVGHEHYVTNIQDASNLFVHISSENTNVTYYAGFGWKKSGQFQNKNEWNEYLQHFSEGLKNPLLVRVQ
ncbi:protein of unknown function [Maribacter orientalis]|uniref:DUF4861 domain-containing protein n=1 Tax=Maribacter orientalis TaxID=228957 RepID=A0A1H7NQ37_9FLAO|nr:DUF4861 family protein [Maribacter orientalis]SEL25145.1 protein of unknown function [Maribacter orientalis]